MTVLKYTYIKNFPPAGELVKFKPTLFKFNCIFIGTELKYVADFGFIGSFIKSWYNKPLKNNMRTKRGV